MVRGVDVTQSAVDTINRGEIHIEEADLDGLVQGVVSARAALRSTEMAEADVFVIAVPTPFDKDHAPDISDVLAAGEPRQSAQGGRLRDSRIDFTSRHH